MAHLMWDVKDYNREMIEQGTPEKCFHDWEEVEDEITGNRYLAKGKLAIKGMVAVSKYGARLIRDADDYPNGHISFKPSEAEIADMKRNKKRKKKYA